MGYRILLAVLVAGFTAVPCVAADEPSGRAMEMAERIVELQRMREFKEIEWDTQLEAMKGFAGEDADMDIPDVFYDAMRDQQVEAPADEWVSVIARSLEPGDMEAIIRMLEGQAYQEWLAIQINLYPDYVYGVMERMMATGEVVSEELAEQFSEDTTASEIDFEPVTNDLLAGVFEYAPGSRVEARIEGMMFDSVRIPARHVALTSVFADFEVGLVPDGETARVATISAERAFDSVDECERKRDQLQRDLAGYFEDTETTDCGDIRHLNNGGDTRMTVSCHEQTSIGGARLSLRVVHKPTENAMYSGFLWPDTSEGDQEAEPGAPVEASVN